MSKHIILFLAANPLGTTELALGREARAIQEELERSGQRDKFEFVTRWAVRPLDLIRELRKLKPTVVHFSGHGGSGGRQHGTGPRRDIVAELGGDGSADDSDNQCGLFFQGSDGRPQLVTAVALRETFEAAGASVKLVVLNACYSDIHAEALLVHIDCVVGMSGSLRDGAARAFATGFYGGLGERQSVAAAYLQGCAAIGLEEPSASERPQLRVRDGVDASQLILAETNAVDRRRPILAYSDAEVEQLSKRLEDARARRDKLRSAGIAADHLDREILELRRQLRGGSQLRAGDTLSNGRYVLVKVVGRGGFAVVWEAYDRTAQQHVAIKVLHSNLAGDPVRRERFFRGARAMMNLTHPALVRVLRPRGEEGGFHYFVMEFAPGGDLREAVLKRRLKRDELLPIVLQVGEALATTHARGMVHRDVKPSNILLDQDGHAKLTDFDLVGARDTTGGTRTGALGTFIYAAPECLERPQDATARADVYGLGMTLIFCLLGRELSPLTYRDSEPTIAKLDCPPEIKKAIRKAVAWEPQERFPDAATMITELRNAVAVSLQAVAAAGQQGQAEISKDLASGDIDGRPHQIRTAALRRSASRDHHRWSTHIMGLAAVLVALSVAFVVAAVIAVSGPEVPQYPLRPEPLRQRLAAAATPSRGPIAENGFSGYVRATVNAMARTENSSDETVNAAAARASPTTPAKAEKRHGGRSLQDVKSEATGLYRSKSFSGAALAINSSLSGFSGDDVKDLRAIAAIYSQLGNAYAVGMAPGTKPIEAYQALPRAIDYDREVGAAYTQELRDKLVAVAPRAATSYMGAKSFEQAFQAVRLAEVLGSKSDDLKIVRQSLVDKANELLRAARSELATDPEAAKQKLRQIQGMVERQHTLWQQAAKLLNGP